MDDGGCNDDLAVLEMEMEMVMVMVLGFDAAYGARPLKRAIQRLVLNPLSRLLLSGEVQRNDTVQVRLANDADAELSFSVVTESENTETLPRGNGDDDGDGAEKFAAAPP